MTARAAIGLLLAVLIAALGCSGSGEPAVNGEVTAGAPIAAGPVAERTSENGPIRATVSVRPDSPRLGDLIGFELRVVAADGVEVTMPTIGEALDRFDMVELPEESAGREDGAQVLSQRYVLQAVASGRWRIPPLRITYRDRRQGVAEATGDEQELLTEEIPLQVAAIELAGGGELRPVREALDEEVGRRSTGLVWWIAGGVLVVLTLVGGFLIWRRRGRRGPAESAHAIAWRRLAELERRGLPGPDEADGWYVELSGIVRHYLEDQFALRAPELTTEEFLREAGRSARLTAEHRALLEGFLGACDRVKFAAYQPGDTESQASLEAARRFLSESSQQAPELDADGQGTPSQERAA